MRGALSKLLFKKPACKSCKGAGHHSQGGLLPQTCETCNGCGYKIDPLLTAVGIAVLIITMVGPLWLLAR